MKKSEVAKVLTFVSSVEGREAATPLQVDAWFELVEDLDYTAAMGAAREHYLSESRRLWPADLRGAVSSSDVQFDIDAEQAGRMLSEQLWKNAVLIPYEALVVLGAARLRNDDRALVETRRALENDFGLRRRQSVTS